MQKSETWSPTYTIHKYKLKMDKRLKYKSCLLYTYDAADDWLVV